jgi:hypothetical protein
MSLGETQGSNTMYIVEIEERDSGEKEYKAFIKSSDAVDYWSTKAAPYAADEEPAIVCKIFKANTNNIGVAIALTKAGKAEFFDFGGYRGLSGRTGGNRRGVAARSQRKENRSKSR